MQGFNQGSKVVQDFLTIHSINVGGKPCHKPPLGMVGIMMTWGWFMTGLPQESIALSG